MSTGAPMRAKLKPTFTSHLAKLLVTMALDGRGMAWLPESLISEDLAAGRLVRSGEKEWDVPIEIHLFRPRSRLSPVAEKFWNQVTSLKDGFQALNETLAKSGE